MSIVIEEAFILQMILVVLQMIVWSLILSKLKPLVARKYGVHSLLRKHLFGLR